MTPFIAEMRMEIAIAVDSGLQGQALVDCIIDRLCRRFGGTAVYFPKKIKEAPHAKRGSFPGKPSATGNSHPGKTHFLRLP